MTNLLSRLWRWIPGAVIGLAILWVFAFFALVSKQEATSVRAVHAALFAIVVAVGGTILSALGKWLVARRSYSEVKGKKGSPK